MEPCCTLKELIYSCKHDGKPIRSISCVKKEVCKMIKYRRNIQRKKLEELTLATIPSTRKVSAEDDSVNHS